ncbi:MAG TPA: hypothetical protein VNE62_08580 [Actinomycetota bacterium]|nr:hypothetical protein [Actinomycetota bacterium]
MTIDAMAGLLVLIACVWWGFSLLRLLGVGLKPELRWAVAPVAGLAAGVWVLYLLCSAAGSMSLVPLAGAVVLFALTAAAARLRPSSPPGRPAPWFVLTAVCIGGGLLALNVYGVLPVLADGNVWAAEHVWADTPFHSGIINTFAHGGNFPPQNTLALGHPLKYPFLVDFASAVVVWGGGSLRLALVSVNLLVGVAFFCGLAALTHRATGSRRAAVLACLLFFFLGNLGWLSIPGDVARAGGLLDWLGDLPWSYTGDSLGNKGRDRLGIGVYLGNPVFMFLLPRRSGAFGLATGTAVLLLADDLVDLARLGKAALMGLLLGVLPRIHAHTAMAMAVALPVWFMLSPLREPDGVPRRWLRAWRRLAPSAAVAGTVALAVALPQVLAMTRQPEGFSSGSYGWIGEAQEAGLRLVGGEWGALATIGLFWLLNGGLLLLAAVPGLLLGGRRLAVFYLPFALLWLLGNRLRTQPYEWDNSNHFVWWQVGTTVVAAGLLARWLDRSRSGPPAPAPDPRTPGQAPVPGTAARQRVSPDPRPARLWTGVRPFVAGLAIAGIGLGGVLSFTYSSQHRMFLWTAGDIEFARRVRASTLPGDVVLTAAYESHSHPVNALSGRQMYMGWGGWLEAHGVDSQAYVERVLRMYSGDTGLMRLLGVDYVVLGPHERGHVQRAYESQRPELQGPDPSPGLLANPELRTVLRADVNGHEWRLLRLVPGPGQRRQ